MVQFDPDENPTEYSFFAGRFYNYLLGEISRLERNFSSGNRQVFSGINKLFLTYLRLIGLGVDTGINIPSREKLFSYRDALDRHTMREFVNTIKGKFGFDSYNAYNAGNNYEMTRGFTHFDRIEKYERNKDDTEYRYIHDYHLGYNSLKPIDISWLLSDTSDTVEDIEEVPDMTGRVRIFIVHGRNEAHRHKVEVIVRRLGLKPVILFLEPNQGRTIIEKLEQCSDDVFKAIIILSPDDVGMLAENGKKGHRARQNVVFEMGYFIGKLGRKNVVFLLGENVEKPSDIDGIVYLPLDVDEEVLEAKLRKEFGVS